MASGLRCSRLVFLFLIDSFQDVVSPKKQRLITQTLVGASNIELTGVFGYYMLTARMSFVIHII